MQFVQEPHSTGELHQQRCRKNAGNDFELRCFETAKPFNDFVCERMS